MRYGVAALDNKYRYTTLTNTDTVAKWLALQVSNVRDPGSIPGARDPIFLPRIKVKRIISSVPAATSTAGNYYYHRRQPNAIHASKGDPDVIDNKNRGVTMVALPSLLSSRI